MKKQLITLALLILAVGAYAQETNTTKKAEPLKSNAIKINPISPFWDCVQLSYLRRMSEDLAFNISLGYMNYTPSANLSNYDNEKTVAVFFAPEIRYYLENKHVENLYVSGFMRFINMQYSRDEGESVWDPINGYTYTIQNYSATYSSLGLGLLVGKEFIYKNRIILDGFVGPVYSFIVSEQNNFPNVGTYGNSANDDLRIGNMFSNNLLRRYGIRAGFTIGYMF